MDINGTWCTLREFYSWSSGGDGIPRGKNPWFCNNRGEVQAASRIGFGGRTEHIDMKLKCTRESAGGGLIEVKYVCSKEQRTDSVSKRNQKPLVDKFMR